MVGKVVEVDKILQFMRENMIDCALPLEAEPSRRLLKMGYLRIGPGSTFSVVSLLQVNELIKKRGPVQGEWFEIFVPRTGEIGWLWNPGDKF